MFVVGFLQNLKKFRASMEESRERKRGRVGRVSVFFGVSVLRLGFGLLGFIGS